MIPRFAQEYIPESLKKLLLNLVGSPTLAHLLVFVSPSLQAANCVAKDFLLTWLSSSSRVHPDLLEVKTTGKIGLHSIENIRTVLEQLSLTPHTAQGRSILIESADRMLPPTANALLKALEEPSSRTLIALTTDSPHRILPTILSRAQTIRIPCIEKGEEESIQRLLEYMRTNHSTYSILQELCDDVQKKLEQEISLLAKKNVEETSKQYGDLSAVAKQELHEEIEASSSYAYQIRSKKILESIYLHTRLSFDGDQGVRLLLEAVRGIDAGAELSYMLLWFITRLSVCSSSPY